MSEAVLRSLEDKRKRGNRINLAIGISVLFNLIFTMLAWQLVVIPIVQSLTRDSGTIVATLIAHGLVVWTCLSNVGLVSFWRSQGVDSDVAGMGDLEMWIMVAAMLQTLGKRKSTMIPREVMSAWSSAIENRNLGIESKQERDRQKFAAKGE